MSFHSLIVIIIAIRIMPILMDANDVFIKEYTVTDENNPMNIFVKIVAFKFSFCWFVKKDKIK